MSRFEIRAWSHYEGTETVAEWTVLDNGRDTMIVEDNVHILEAAIADGSLAKMIDGE